jgi:hypothetical protein
MSEPDVRTIAERALSQTSLRGMRQIAGMCRDRYAVVGREVERLAGGEIAPRLGLEVADNRRGEDGSPGKAVAPRLIAISEMLPFDRLWNRIAGPGLDSPQGRSRRRLGGQLGCSLRDRCRCRSFQRKEVRQWHLLTS